MIETENEKTILGHLVRYPEHADEISDGLDKTDFSSLRHGAIFEAARVLMGEGFDVLRLSSELESQGWEIRPSELLAFEEFAYDGADLSRVKQEIRNESQKRSLADYLVSTLQRIKEPGSDLVEIKHSLSERLTSIQPVFGKSPIKKASDFYDELLNEPQDSKAIMTGLSSFDRKFGGLRPSELTVGTGETSSGKTTFFTAFVPYSLARMDYPVLVASFEMTTTQILKKMTQMTKGRPFQELTIGEKRDGLEFVNKIPVAFVDVFGQIGLRELKAYVYEAKRKADIKLVVLDHLHFFLRYSPDQERHAIDQALIEIKGWCMSLGIHVFLVVHPKFVAGNNEPIMLNDLKGSSGLKQLPDNILSIWRPRNPDDSKHPQSEIILYILKVRDDSGDEGKVILTFDKRSQSYSDSGHGEASPSEGKGISHPSPSVRPGRDWTDVNQ